MATTRQDPVWGDPFFRLATCAGLILIVVYTVTYMHRKALWDLLLYQDAMDRYLAGENPYLSVSRLEFVYPPVFLAALRWTGPYLAHLLVGLYSATLVLLGRRSVRPLLIGMALYSVAFFFYARPITVAVASGNLTFYAHILLILTWLEGGRWRSRAFPLLIVVFSSLKPYYLAYALVPVMVLGPNAAVLVRAAVVVVATLAVWGVQALAVPDAFGQFLTALQQQAFRGDATGPRADVGFGYFGLLAKATGSAALALALHAGLSALCVGAVLRWRRWLARWSERQGVDTLGLVALLVAILVNPRLKIYDYCFVGSLAAYLVAFLWRDRRKIWFFVAWPILDLAERQVPGPLLGRILDAHLLTIVLVVLLVRAARSADTAAPAR